jgi:hypothetical protein
MPAEIKKLSLHRTIPHWMASAPEPSYSWEMPGMTIAGPEDRQNATPVGVGCRVLHIASEIDAIHAGNQVSDGVFNETHILWQIFFYLQGKVNTVFLCFHAVF